MSPRAWIVFGVVSVLSGSAFLLIELALEAAPPVVVAFARTALAALVLLPVARRAGALDGLRGRGRAVLGVGVLEFALPFALVAAGTERIASSLTGVLLASGPLLLAGLALRLDRRERVTRARLAGMVVGLAGVACLLGLEVRGSAREATGALLVLGAAASFSAGTLLIGRAFAGCQPLGVVAAGLAAGAALLAVPAALALPAAAPPAGAVVALLGLGLVQTSVNFLLFFDLIARVGAARATLTTYVAPAVAVVLGVVLLDEPLTAALLAGLVLVLAGSRLAAGPPAPG